MLVMGQKSDAVSRPLLIYHPTTTSALDETSPKAETSAIAPSRSRVMSSIDFIRPIALSSPYTTSSVDPHEPVGSAYI